MRDAPAALTQSPVAPDEIEAELTRIWRRHFSPRSLNTDRHLLEGVK